MRRTWKNFLSLLLAIAMILSLGATAIAEPETTEAEATGNVTELSFEQVDNDIISERLPLANELTLEEKDPLYADEDIVRVSIVLDGPSAIDAGFAPAAAGTFRAGLKAEQDAMANRISAQALDGAQLDVVWNITLAANIISANVPYGRIENIKDVPGVRDVVIELQYFTTEDEVENIIATEMTGATKAWNLGYTGAGSKIAVVDTGLDVEHLSFDPAAFQYAIDELNEGRETPVKLMTAEDVAAVWGDLNAAKFIGSADGVYLNAKVPYAVNYVDRDLDVTHANDTQGEHGSHVAGIAAANKYVSVDGEFKPALEAVETQGEAPDAQLLIMKVFGKGGGAYDSDYMVAVEDAMTLGCDAVNLSLGSSVAGFTTNATYAATLDKLTQYGLVWANSAGNNYSWSNDATGPNSLYADDVNFQTGGSPATYNNTLSVASVDNTVDVLGVPMELENGAKITFAETQGYGNEPISTIPGTYTYIMLLPNQNGSSDGDEETQLGALGSEILEGKVAVAWRGGSSFYVKANAAAANGAVATIVANNTAGVINMNLSGYEYTAPAVSILQNDGFRLLGAGEQKQANDVNYIEGTIIIPEGVATTTESNYQQMSDFSSWGGNGALTMKPEITAPGGNIWSVWGMNVAQSSPQSGHDQYEIMSGTSMASPQVAGTVAVLKQYIRETGLAEKLGMTERQVAQSLLMSTSMPLLEPATGNYWSVLKQGSGLVNVNNAITSRSLIQVTDVPDTAPESAEASIADGKVKVELGEMFDNTFSTTFELTNISDEELYLELNGEFFTQLVEEYFRTEYTTPIAAGIVWTVDGEPYEPAGLSKDYDFNGDGMVNGMDAQHLLNWCANESLKLYNEENADLDEDGNVDTHDAKIAFEGLNGVGLSVPAGETVTITANVSFDLSEYENINGNYIEGFLFVREGASADGALGVEHSIPVFGFYGNYTDASMFDRGSYLEYTYEFGDGDPQDGVYPYMSAASALGEDALDVETFVALIDGDQYYFGGNPVAQDETYMPERNALNAKNSLAAVRYSQIRNSAAWRFYVTDENGNIVKGSELETLANDYAAYYYRSKSVWQQTNTTKALGYSPKDVEEGTALTAHFQLAPEYYVDALGTVRWDALGKGSEISIPFVIDNTAPQILETTRDNNYPAELSEDETDIMPAEGYYDKLNVKVKDNQFIAGIALYDDKGTFLTYFGSDDEAEPNQETTYTFDLRELFKTSDTTDTDVVEAYPYLLVEVYDYALNLSTYKINFKAEEEGTEVTSVTVDPAEAVIIGTGSIQLTASVRPWGLDESVTCTSDNEAVAVVDENGVVTGVTEGTAVITATSVADPTKTATCEVTVMFIDKELNGVVWDEEGQVWPAEFNLNSIPAYDKLTEESWRTRITSMTYDEDMNLYGVTYDSDDDVSSLYLVNPEDWTMEEIGSSTVGYWDICQAPSLGEDHLLAVYGPYVLIVNKTTGAYEGAFDLSSYTNNNNLVGIAYEEQYNHPSYGNTDWVFLVDAAGNLYTTGFLPYGGSYSRFNVTAMGSTGYSCDTPYFQSLYYDGASMYWSCFNEGANKVDIVMVNDLYNDGSIFMAGSFADGVWPVGGLFELGVNPAFPADDGNKVSDHSDAVIDENAVYMTEIPGEEALDDELVEMEEGPIGTIAPVGGLDFSRVELPGDADTQKIDTSIAVEITAEELSTNGKIVVDYDPKTVTLISATPYSQFKGILDQTEEAGHYVLAWVDLEGIEADGLILKLKFATDSNGIVTITTVEENERDPEADENLPRVEEVVLGNPEHQCPCAAFEDMPPYGTTEHDAIDWAYTHDPQITKGIDLTHFGPEQTVTRGQAVTFLWRAAGCPNPESNYCPFTDVKEGAYYYTAMLWAIEQGITNGTSATTFSPNDTCTRAQIITFVYRFRGEPAYDTSAECPYTDVKAGSSYYGAMMWALQNGIEVGTSATTWEPKTGCTRAAIVTYLYRIFTGNGLLN